MISAGSRVQALEERHSSLHCGWCTILTYVRAEHTCMEREKTGTLVLYSETACSSLREWSDAHPDLGVACIPP